MLTAHIDHLKAEDVWAEGHPSIRSRDAYPISWANGASASAVVYFELEPGCRLGSHRHSAEEVLYVIAGSVEATVSGERSSLAAGSMAVVPALAAHDVTAVGDQTVRCLGFFGSGAVETVFEQPLQPAGSRLQGSPSPEVEE